MLAYARVPGFYAEIERARDASLAQRPVVVGGDPRKRGLVQAATADAHAAGVQDGMPMMEALALCSNARALRTNMKLYREVSAVLRACFREETRRVEPCGLEAAFLDPSDAADAPELIATRLRERVRAELRLPLQVGIAPVKFLAKLAAEESGNEGVLRVDRSHVQDFLSELPVARLPGVGPKTVVRLAELGAGSVGELRALGARALEDALGNHGLSILAYAEGRDSAVVRPAPHPRTLSQESTFEQAELDRGALEERLGELALRLETALAREHLMARRLVLKARSPEGDVVTRSRTLDQPVAEATELVRLALALLDRTQAGTRPIRGLGLAVASLVRSRSDDRQLELF